MKKILTGLMLLFTFVLGLTLINNVKAEEEVIDLYPYDQEACLLADDSCTHTKVGDSHWSFTYFGHRYHVIRDLVRYGHESIDLNSDGWVDDNELAGIPYNAFASVFINNTGSEIDIKTANARTDITDVVHRKYAYFDENGVLQMFEDHISNYYIYNDGDATTPDWRLATQTEIDAYQAEVAAETISDGDPSSDGLTRYSPIRIKLDSSDSDGYVVESLGWLKWTNADVDTSVVTDPTQWSTIIADDPNNVYVPAGWVVVSFGTLDRGTANPKTTEFIKTLPYAMTDSSVTPMFMTYEDQPGWFSGMSDLDDDAVTPGVNIVVDYNGTFDLPDTVSASWMNMFDDTTNDIIHRVDKLDYSVEIYQDDNLLQTIDFTWNEGTGEYDASGAQTVIDTSVFGAAYKAVFKTNTPNDDPTEVSADIVIGVMPPKFMGVENRYSDEGVFVDLMQGISADDGYGNDLTDTVSVTVPDGFNYYSPKPGVYDINLEFTHHVHFDGIIPFVVLGGTQIDFDGSLNIVSTDWDSTIAVYTDVSQLQATTMSWGSSGVIIEVAGDGTVIRTINRHNWDLVDENGLNTPANASGMFDGWLSGLTLEEDGFIIIVGYKLGDAYATAQGLAYGDSVSYDLTQKDDFDYDIVTDASYVLTIDDTTNPYAVVVDDNYTIEENSFDNVNDAILANVVGFDNFDSADDLAVYVSDNGGMLLDTAGTYTVEVTVEDVAGNATTVEFDVTVVTPDPVLTAEDVQVMLDDQTLTAEEIQALIDASVLTTEDVQALIDGANILTEAQIQTLIDNAIVASQPEDTGCGSATANIPNFGIIAAFTLLGAGFVIFRKHQ